MLERIGNCRIVEEVASGGMAVVYRAVQDPLGRTVAIKALKTSAMVEENVVTRFEREAKSLANLQHENIIHVYDYIQERGAMFIVMEYVQGIDLYDLLEKCGRLPYDVATITLRNLAGESAKGEGGKFKARVATRGGEHDGPRQGPIDERLITDCELHDR